MATEFSDLQSERERTAGAPRSQFGREIQDEEQRPQTHAASVAHRKLSESYAPTSLGWLSIGLGMTALLAPRTVGNLTGLHRQSHLLRFVGLRELASGIGLLTAPNKTPWLWSRVIGDAMDLTLLGSAAISGRAGSERAMVATAVVGAIAAADLGASIRHTTLQRRESGRVDAYVEKSVTVNKTPQECYEFWHDLTHLPRFMSMVESVTPLDERHWHWVVRTPGGGKVEWDAEVTVDRPGERLAWHSVKGSPIDTASVVQFDPAPGGRGTLVRVVMHFDPPAGRLGLKLAKLIGRNPASEVREDLRRFRQLIETGELPTTHGQPSGRRSWFTRRFSHEGSAA